MNIPQSSFPRVVIIGGGFAGLAAAKGLEKQELQVVLVDKHNYHTFQPLLYQVATGGLEPDSIAFPLRKRFNDVDNFYFRLAEVVQIHSDKNLIETKYIWKYPTKFSGKTTYHSTENYYGDRWCIVAYQTKPPYHYCPFTKELISI